MKKLGFMMRGIKAIPMSRICNSGSFVIKSIQVSEECETQVMHELSRPIRIITDNILINVFKEIEKRTNSKS